MSDNSTGTKASAGRALGARPGAARDTPVSLRLNFSAVASRTRRVAYVTLVIAALIAAVGISALFAMRRSARSVTHTHMVLEMIERVLSDVRDVELGERSFLVTGDSTYIQTYLSGRSRISPDMQRLRTLTRDNPEQVQRVAQMDRLIARRLVLVADRLQVQHTVGTDSAIQLIKAGEGRRVMDALRSTAAAAAATEHELLVLRAARQERDLWGTIAIIALGLISTVYLVWSTNVHLLRILRARERAERQAVEAREHAEAANRAKSDFLARMSHELRTPLNSVIGFANVMTKNKDGHLRPSDITYLERIQANGRHLLSLINQILDLSKIEAGRVEVIVEAIDIGQLVTDVVSQFEPAARERGIVVRADIPPRLLPVNTDGEKLRQILINLVGNAVKFTERGSVTVIVRARRGTVSAITVRDTGIGIPQERLNAVFEAFEQAETSTTRRYGGTGLGLSISRSLAHLLELELTVDSELGMGTTFTLLFSEENLTLTPPRGVKTGEWALAQPVNPELLRDRLILIIDDDADSRILLSQFLEDLGCRVMAATNGEQGLRVANRFSPDAILLDLRMPGMDGWEVVRRLQGDPALQYTPTVVVSVIATEHPDRASSGLALLDKPCTRDDLGAALTRVLRNDEQRQA